MGRLRGVDARGAPLRGASRSAQPAGTVRGRRDRGCSGVDAAPCPNDTGRLRCTSGQRVLMRLVAVQSVTRSPQAFGEGSSAPTTSAVSPPTQPENRPVGECAPGSAAQRRVLHRLHSARKPLDAGAVAGRFAKAGFPLRRPATANSRHRPEGSQPSNPPPRPTPHHGSSSGRPCPARGRGRTGPDETTAGAAGSPRRPPWIRRWGRPAVRTARPRRPWSRTRRPWRSRRHPG